MNDASVEDGLWDGSCEDDGVAKDRVKAKWVARRAVRLRACLADEVVVADVNAFILLK